MLVLVAKGRLESRENEIECHAAGAKVYGEVFNNLGSLRERGVVFCNVTFSTELI